MGEQPGGLLRAARSTGCRALVALALALSAATMTWGAEHGSSAVGAGAIFNRLQGAIAAPTKPFAWELQVSADPTITAFATGRGRIVVGRGYVERLGLDEPELAMLMAHEMAHIVAGHRRAVPSRDQGDGDPAAELQASAAAIAQEEEADAIGFAIATAAGWPPQALLGFFEKLARDEPAGQFSRTHASARQRLERAREEAAKRKPGSASSPAGPIAPRPVSPGES